MMLRKMILSRTFARRKTCQDGSCRSTTLRDRMMASRTRCSSGRQVATQVFSGDDRLTPSLAVDRCSRDSLRRGARPQRVGSLRRSGWRGSNLVVPRRRRRRSGAGLDCVAARRSCSAGGRTTGAVGAANGRAAQAGGSSAREVGGPRHLGWRRVTSDGPQALPRCSRRG